MVPKRFALFLRQYKSSCSNTTTSCFCNHPWSSSDEHFHLCCSHPPLRRFFITPKNCTDDVQPESAFFAFSVSLQHPYSSSDDDGVADYIFTFDDYNGMLRSGVVPDDHTFPFVLKLCTDYTEIKKGLEVHGMLMKLGFDYDVFVNNTLLFYGSFGDSILPISAGMGPNNSLEKA